MFMLKPDSTLNGTKTGKLWRPYSQDRVYHCFFVIVELPPLSLLKFAILLSLISKLMVIGLDDRMVNTHNGRAGHENAPGNRNPPPPPSLAQAITSILESREEQNELLR
jgi:hypothetical protein